MSKILLEGRASSSYVIAKVLGPDDIRKTKLIQDDYDFPKLARTFGWNGKYRNGKPLDECKNPKAAIRVAEDYLDRNVGKVAVDPRYFED